MEAKLNWLNLGSASQEPTATIFSNVRTTFGVCRPYRDRLCGPDRISLCLPHPFLGYAGQKVLLPAWAPRKSQAWPQILEAGVLN